MDDQNTPTDTPQDQSTSDQPSSEVNMIFNLEEMIKSHLLNIDQLQEELSKHQGMLDSIFENDSTFKQHSDQAKEAAKIKSATKAQILKQPQVAELSEKVKGIKSEVKQLNDALSDYLREYQRVSGVNEIEGPDGEVREIVYVARLVKKGTNFQK